MARSIGQLTSPDVAAAIASAATGCCRSAASSSTVPICRAAPTSMPRSSSLSPSRSASARCSCPSGPYGVTPIHAGHPETISLRRDVFERLLRNVCEELTRMGVRRLVFVNWHEGNIASLDAVATELQDERGLVIATVQACATSRSGCTSRWAAS